MSVPAISPVVAPPVAKAQTSVLTANAPAKGGSDGDSPAVEAAESSATKISEAQNGGFAPPKGSAGSIISKLA